MFPASLPRPSCRALPEPMPLLEEMVAASPLNRAAALAFALSRCIAAKPALVIVPRGELRELGRPSLHGIAALRPGAPLLMVVSARAVDALWAMEQALKSGALGGVIAAVDTAALTETRRLDFAARDGGTPAMLLRATGGGLSAARRRWRIAALPSAPNPFDPAAPGAPRLLAELVRQRDGPTGAWMLERDAAAGGFAVVDRLAADGVAAAPRAPPARRAA